MKLVYIRLYLSLCMCRKSENENLIENVQDSLILTMTE